MILKVVVEKNFDLFFFVIIDILENDLFVFVIGNEVVKVEKVFNVILENNIVFLKGVVFCKK